MCSDMPLSSNYEIEVIYLNILTRGIHLMTRRKFYSLLRVYNFAYVVDFVTTLLFLGLIFHEEHIQINFLVVLRDFFN